MKPYHYTTKHLPKDIWSILDAPTTRIRLLKDSMGCGATYGAMLRPCRTRKFLVMPTINLIRDKLRQALAGEFNPQKTIALCSETEYKFADIEDANIVLLTPDQLVIIYEKHPKLWNTIKTDAVVIDEEHLSESHGTYREAFRKLNVILQAWSGAIVTITATEPFTTTPFLSTFEVLRTIKTGKPQQTLLATNDELTFWNKFDEYYERGESIVLVTNEIKNFIRVQNKGKNIYTLTGPNLRLKLEAQTISQKMFYQAHNLIVLSSSAMEGIDLPKTAHVMVLADYRHNYTAFSLQSIVQATGRPRKGLLESVVCVKKPKHKLYVDSYTDLAIKAKNNIIDCQSKYTNPKQLKDNLEKQPNVITIKVDPHVDEQLINSEIAKQINNNLFFDDNWIALCNKHLQFNNIDLKEVNELPVISSVMKKRAPLAKTVQHFLSKNEIDRKQYLHDAILNMTGGRHGAISPSVTVALLITETITMIKDKEVIQQLLKLNDYTRALQVLNSIAVATSKHASTKGKSTQAITLANKQYGHLKHIYSKREVEIIQVLYYLTAKTDMLRDALFWEMDRKSMPIEERKEQKKQWTVQLKELASLVLNNCTTDRQEIKSTRAFSALTSLSMPLINTLYPYSVLEIDITSANPTFVDNIVGSNLAGTIYSNIMTAHSATRDEAKVLYNRTLNEWHTKPVDRFNKFYSWGYTKDEAEQIIDNSQVRGEMYSTMTEAEQVMIDKLMLHFDYKNKSRRHDSIVFFGTEAEMQEQIDVFDLNCETHKYHVNLN